MGEAISTYLSDYGIPRELIIFLISMLPVVELRGGLPVAALLHIPWIEAFVICVIGNMVPVPFIVIFIRKIFNYLKRLKPFKKIVDKFENRANTKSSGLKDKRLWGKLIGIFIFVAIPLPGTGAWTGSLISAFLGLRLRHAMPAIFAGVACSGGIMLLLSYLFPNLLF